METNERSVDAEEPAPEIREDSEATRDPAQRPSPSARPVLRIRSGLRAGVVGGVDCVDC
jgi:hypothetical protein